MAKTKTNTKYNATEVHITRSVAGMFIFGILIVSVWLVRHLYRDLPFLYIVVAALFALATVVLGWLAYREKKAGGEQKIFGMDYWLYIAVAGTIVHGGMALALSENLRAVVQPVMYEVLIVMYLIYVIAWNLDRSFKGFACLCAVACVLPMAHFQCFYDQRVFVGTNPVPMVSADTRATVGWVVLVAAALCFLWLRYKKGRSCWKQLGVLAILALYWVLLFSLKSASFWLTLGVTIVIAVYFVLLRVLRQIKVIR